MTDNYCSIDFVRYYTLCICLASSGRNAFEFTLSPSRGVGLPTKRSATSKIVAIFRVTSGDAGLAASTPSVSKMLNKYFFIVPSPSVLHRQRKGRNHFRRQKGRALPPHPAT